MDGFFDRLVGVLPFHPDQFSAAAYDRSHDAGGCPNEFQGHRPFKRPARSSPMRVYRKRSARLERAMAGTGSSGKIRAQDADGCLPRRLGRQPFAAVRHFRQGV